MRRFVLAAALFISATVPAIAGGALSVAMDSNLTGLDPNDMNDNASLSAGRLMFQGLYGFDNDMKMIPVLAESYEANDAATEFSFHLRHGINFVDGTPFNAAAVKVNLFIRNI